ncbi:ECF subfamily RNA polymerase sigma factor, BldN family [Streptomyces sp. NPDC059466]|uniref:ECF subfamily RNA polymerase sigma factor, BldN family n=1 Tax=unclassified Streptomyces TaxID=2593676 RepID=UPI00367F0A79
MSVEERLGQAHRVLEEMWSDEAATADRLRRFLGHTDPPQHIGPIDEVVAPPETAVPAHTNAHSTGDLSVRSETQTRTLCSTGSRGPSAQAAPPPNTFETGSGSTSPADEDATPTARRPAADSDSARMMDLVERAQAGEADAFGRLYDQYSDTVYRYIYYRVGGKATAEDLTSETFLRALRRIGTFTWQGRDFGAWLVTIARNLVADHFKSSRFRLEVTTGEMLDANEVERSPEDSVLEPLADTLLLDAVRHLSAQQQECVTLRFLQGLSVAETARVMGKNEGAIKALQHRALEGLARLLK